MQCFYIVEIKIEVHATDVIQGVDHNYLSKFVWSPRCKVKVALNSPDIMFFGQKQTVFFFVCDLIFILFIQKSIKTNKKVDNN